MFAKLSLYVACLFGAGALLMLAGHMRRRATRSQRQQDWTKFGAFLVIVTTMLLLGAWSRSALAILLALIAVFGAAELVSHLSLPWPQSLQRQILLTLALMAAFSHLLIPFNERWFGTAAFVMLLVAITDSFSQLWGKLLGRRHPFPHLSPGKTLAGLLLGIMSAVVGAYALRWLLGDTAVGRAVILGLTTAVAAVAGDLLFSFIKRRLDIKDFSQSIPGHGGLLDRFDSLVLAAPAFYWTSNFILR